MNRLPAAVTRLGRGDLVRGQLWQFGGLALCVALRPEGLSANSGISYYGVYGQTVVPYAAGLLGAAFYTRRGLHAAAPLLPAPDFLRWTGNAFAVLAVGVALTPHTLNALVSWIHRGFGAALFVLQLVLSIRLAGWAGRDRLAIGLLTLQLAGGLASAGYVLRDTGLLLEGQIVFQAAFGAVVIRTVGRLAGTFGPTGRDLEAPRTLPTALPRSLAARHRDLR